MEKYSINDLNAFALQKDGKCVSDYYIKSSYKYTWECVSGHQWESNWNNILSKGTWCPKCANRERKTIEDMQTLAANRGGKCISSEYVNWKTKLEWQCVIGHKWFATPNSVQQGHWCKNCSIYYSEEKCRYIFETLFSKSFPRDRCVLRNGQELDGFNNVLNLAFEYDGEQHFRFIPRFHKNFDNFRKLQMSDQNKDMLCKSFGIRLIRISYDYGTDEGLVKFICEKTNIPFRHISFIDFYKNVSPVVSLKEVVNKRGGKIISGTYSNSKSRMEFECANTHRWITQVNHIRSGRWCPHCAGNAKLNMQRISQIAIQNDCICLSRVYKNAKSSLRWQCLKCNIIWSMPYDQIRLRWCLNCKDKLC